MRILISLLILSILIVFLYSPLSVFHRIRSEFSHSDYPAETQRAFSVSRFIASHQAMLKKDHLISATLPIVKKIHALFESDIPVSTVEAHSFYVWNNVLPYYLADGSFTPTPQSKLFKIIEDLSRSHSGSLTGEQSFKPYTALVASRMLMRTYYQYADVPIERTRVEDIAKNYTVIAQSFDCSETIRLQRIAIGLSGVETAFFENGLALWVTAINPDHLANASSAAQLCTRYAPLFDFLHSYKICSGELNATSEARAKQSQRLRSFLNKNAHLKKLIQQCNPYNEAI